MWFSGHQLRGLADACAGRQVDDLTFDQLDDGSLAHGGGPIPAMDEPNLPQFAAPRAFGPRPPMDRRQAYPANVRFRG